MFPPRVVRAKKPLYAFKPEACRLVRFLYQRKSFVSILTSTPAAPASVPAGASV